MTCEARSGKKQRGQSGGVVRDHGRTSRCLLSATLPSSPRSPCATPHGTSQRRRRGQGTQLPRGSQASERARRENQPRPPLEPLQLRREGVPAEQGLCTPNLSWGLGAWTTSEGAVFSLILKGGQEPAEDWGGKGIPSKHTAHRRAESVSLLHQLCRERNTPLTTAWCCQERCRAHYPTSRGLAPEVPVQSSLGLPS